MPVCLQASFECIIKRQIARLQDPSLQCAELIFQELRRIAVQCERKELQRFPNLRSKLFEVKTVCRILAGWLAGKGRGNDS